MRESQENGVEGEVIRPSEGNGFIESVTRGEVDTQITTARRYPRSVKAFKEKALSYATLDEETAASCFYVLPARKGGDGKAIEGPSTRLAEIVAASWGNLRAQSSVVNDDGEFITARGVCWDLENNVAISKDVKRRITDRNGRRYSADMIVVTGNAACSIALRNAVFSVVPGAMTKPVYDACRRIIRGDATTLVKRRSDMVAHFGKLGIPLERVCATIERASIEDITIDDLVILRGMATAIKDGDSSIDELFPTEKPKEPVANGGTKSDKLAESLKKADPEPDTKSEPPKREPGDEPEENETVPSTTGPVADLFAKLEASATSSQAGAAYQEFIAAQGIAPEDRAKGERLFKDRCDAIKAKGK